MKTNFKTAEISSEPKDVKRTEMFEAPVRKLNQPMISTVMNTNLKTAETSSGERTNQQPKETCKSAVRKLQQPVISTVMKENLKVAERNSQERLKQILTASTPETCRVQGSGREAGLWPYVHVRRMNGRANIKTARESMLQRTPWKGTSMRMTVNTSTTSSVHGGSEEGWSMALRSCSADERQGHHQTNRGRSRNTPGREATMRRAVNTSMTSGVHGGRNKLVVNNQPFRKEVKTMNETNVKTKEGNGSKLGISVLNPVVLAGSTANHRKAMVDLRFG
ncbi:MAG: hypothetical protein NTY01_05085, partial [Verrucomicrobia bacterium]|nr:hypothetical protein [Verrucomicrobiota bacterium]